MNPGLISRSRLRPEGSKPDRGRAPFAAAALILAVAVAGVASASMKGPVPVAPQLRAVATASYLPGTQVPSPPPWLLPAKTRLAGRFVFRSGARATSDPVGAFDYYLTSMQQSGWTLSGKADPSRKGDWILRWTFGTQSVLLTFATTPTERLTIDDCPPEPYC
jgi:hypothetical protein